MTDTTDWAGLAAAAASAPDARRPRQYEPNVAYVAGEMASVSISLKEVPADEEKWRAEILRVTQLTVPEDRKVELAGVRYWGDPGAPNVYVRFNIVDRGGIGETVDAVKILKELRGRRKKKGGTLAPNGNDGVFVLSWNDWQVGKAEGGGIAATAERLEKAFQSAKSRILELNHIGRAIDRLVIIGGGDMIEGCSIFPNQPFELDGDRRTQIRATVAFILAGLDSLAPLVGKVDVLVVGGNHGENRIGGKRTNRHDNDDAAVFEHAALAVARDESLSHVEFFIAQDEPAKTLQVGRWILGTTHGQVFGRGAGGIGAKAHRWFSGQSTGRFPVGDADVLVTHHYHHLELIDWGATQWVQTPAMDGGSPHFTDGTGFWSEPGMLSFTMDNDHRFRDLAIL